MEGDMPTARVGVREFRENLSGYLESAAPVAIMRHGKTLGVYVPTPQRPQEENLEALRRAGEQLDALIASSGATEDRLVSEFKTLRKARRARR
jgi:antitoxin (DNA-binding transcriptional repressor) of toxin-antitoxin stability system